MHEGNTLEVRKGYSLLLQKIGTRRVRECTKGTRGTTKV